MTRIRVVLLISLLLSYSPSNAVICAQHILDGNSFEKSWSRSDLVFLAVVIRSPYVTAKNYNSDLGLLLSEYKVIEPFKGVESGELLTVGCNGFTCKSQLLSGETVLLFARYSEGDGVPSVTDCSMAKYRSQQEDLKLLNEKYRRNVGPIMDRLRKIADAAA